MDSENSLLVSLVLGLLLLLFASCGDGAAPGETGTRPVRGLDADSELIVWAWHGGHDLRFLAERPKHARPVSVAYLARRLVVHPEGVEAQLRSAPLLVPADAALTAVVRIEIAGQLGEGALAVAMPQLLEHLARAAGESQVHTLQIDFDVPARLRPTYRQLLREIRAKLRVGQRLEMTALASWCLDDRWIDEDLVDAAVPMLFEMGPESRHLRRRLAGLAELPTAVCRGQLGVSTTDVMPPLLGASRVFVFAPGPWTAARLQSTEEALAAGAWPASR